MVVKTIMIPFQELHCLKVENTLEEALHIIESNRLLSLPVVDGRKFVGILSKEFVYASYFNDFSGTKEEFLQKKVSEMIHTKIMSIPSDMLIEDAAAIFITSKIRFIPVTEKEGILLGIVTQQAVFKEYQKIFGQGYHRILMYTYNYKGNLAKIAGIISREGGNIRNIVQRDTDVMGLQEINLRIDCEDFSRICTALQKHGFDVREEDDRKV